MAHDNRNTEQLREHYQIEKELADRLRQAPKSDRKKLYSEVYNAFFNNISHLPQLSEDEKERQKRVAYNLRELDPLLDADTVYLEVGAGDCKEALAVAGKVKKVIVIEASGDLVSKIEMPANFELIIGDSTEIDLPDNSIDLVFSNQVMEHLHPEDARLQLQHIYRILKPGGQYLCLTPNRVTGPHDISKHFDETASGFHLKEYTINELYNLFGQCGFSKIKIFSRYKSLRLFLPRSFYALKEKFFMKIPFRLRKRMTGNALMLKFFGINIIGKK